MTAISPENVARICADLRNHGDYEWHDRIWDTKRAPVEDILEHEIAHCNGWSPRHESRNSSRDNRSLYAYMWFTIHHRLS